MKQNNTYKQILLISFPIIIGNLAQTIINITDSAFLGMLGQVEFDASAIAGLLYHVLYMAGLAFSIGAQILIARRAGENKKHEIGTIFDNSLYLMIAISALLFIILNFVCPVLLKYSLRSEPIINASNEYLSYRAIGLPFAMINLVFRSYYVGTGKTSILTWNLGLMALINALFCYLLIFGHYGFPSMGIKGAALASTISEGIALLFYLIYTLYKKENKQYRLLKFPKVDFEIKRRITKLSMPIALQHIFSLGGWLVFFMFIEKLGEHELAISNLVRLAYLVMMTPIWGYFAATNTLVSNVIGQGKEHELKELVKKIIYLSLGSALIMIFAVVPFSESVLLMINKDLVLVHDSLTSFYICSLAMFFFAIASVLLSTVSGMGSTSASMRIEGIAVLVYLIYVYIVTIHFRMSVEVAWASEFVYWAMIGLQCLWYLNKTRWKSVKL